MHTRTKFLLPLLALALPACVSTSQYDAALQSASDTRAELRSVVARDRATLADLQAKLDSRGGRRAEAPRQARLGRPQRRRSRLREGAALHRARRLAHALRRDPPRAGGLGGARAALPRSRRQAQEDGRLGGSPDRASRGPDGPAAFVRRSVRLGAGRHQASRSRGPQGARRRMQSLGNRRFEVAGHTDDVPIDTQQFPSNSELVHRRGVVVVHFLIAARRARDSRSPRPATASSIPSRPTSSREAARSIAGFEIALQPNVDELVAVPDVK